MATELPPTSINIMLALAAAGGQNVNISIAENDDVLVNGSSTFIDPNGVTRPIGKNHGNALSVLLVGSSGARQNQSPYIATKQNPASTTEER